MGGVFSSVLGGVIRRVFSSDHVSLLRQVAAPLQLHIQTVGGRFLGGVVWALQVHRAMAEKFADVDFVKIDVDELPEVSQECGVQAMPTFVLFKSGKEVDRVVGAKKDELQKKVDKYRSM